MKVSRRFGGPKLSLERHEVALLQELLEQLTGVLSEQGEAGDPVLDRLFPAAYPDDPDAQDDYRAMTHDALRDERVARVEACAGELAASGDVPLSDPDVGRRWIQVLNDLRLALGTRLGVTDDAGPELDPHDPQAQPWLIYHWLTAVQDTVVTALMR